MVVLQVDMDPRMVNTIDTALFEALYCIALVSIAYGNRGILARAIEGGAKIDMESLVPSLSPTFVMSALFRNSHLRYGITTLVCMFLVLAMPTVSKYGLTRAPSGATTLALKIDWNSPRLYWWTRGQLYDCGMRAKLYHNLTEESLEALTHYRKSFLTGEAFTIGSTRTTSSSAHDDDDEKDLLVEENHCSVFGRGVGVGCVWYANTSNREYEFGNPGYGTVDRIPFDNRMSFYVGNHHQNHNHHNNSSSNNYEDDGGPSDNAITSIYSFRSAQATGNRIPTIYSGVSTKIQATAVYPEVSKVDGKTNPGRREIIHNGVSFAPNDGDENGPMPSTLSFFDLDRNKLDQRTFCDYYATKNSTFRFELSLKKNHNENSNGNNNKTSQIVSTIHLATFATLSAEGALLQYDNHNSLRAHLYSGYGYTTRNSTDSDQEEIDIAAMVVVCFEEEEQQQSQQQPLGNSTTATNSKNYDDSMHCLIEHLALLSTNITFPSSSSSNSNSSTHEQDVQQAEQDMMYLLTHSARARLESVLIGTTDVLEAHVGGLFAALSMSAVAAEVPTGQELVHLKPIWFVGFFTMLLIIVGGMVVSKAFTNDDTIPLPSTPWEGYQFALADYYQNVNNSSNNTKMMTMIDDTCSTEKTATTATTTLMRRKCSDPFEATPPPELALGIMDDAHRANVQHVGLVPKNKIVPRNKQKELGIPPSQQHQQQHSKSMNGWNQTTEEEEEEKSSLMEKQQQQQQTSLEQQQQQQQQQERNDKNEAMLGDESQEGVGPEERSFLIELHGVLSTMSDSLDMLMKGKVHNPILVEVVPPPTPERQMESSP